MGAPILAAPAMIHYSAMTSRSRTDGPGRRRGRLTHVAACWGERAD
jgi:hypothetical protein